MLILTTFSLPLSKRRASIAATWQSSKFVVSTTGFLKNSRRPDARKSLSSNLVKPLCIRPTNEMPTPLANSFGTTAIGSEAGNVPMVSGGFSLPILLIPNLRKACTEKVAFYSKEGERSDISKTIKTILGGCRDKNLHYITCIENLAANSELRDLSTIFYQST